ncbi:ABC transporter substrate-binding protein [Streptomyces sp. NBC_01017]|uniref:ABC transporter substrate-binding protein n=1 Tax=Streptomyces sp. NBC_01017 TaxID=2903721 RepID=UPI0038630F48|nr:ABC transporter substrate-binding protein [Streptomyces sp. NBC_01017]WSV34967.1 ABC transporter substrate-binding protein [Streptomyces sp. NBC_01017]
MNRLLRIPGLAALAALLLVVAGCSSPAEVSNEDSAPGITDTAITIGSHQPLTGPASAGFSHFAPAARAYFDYVNANGGIHGRKIYFNYRDDAYSPDNATQVVRRLVEQDKIFALFSGLGTATHRAVVDYLNAENVPDLFPASGCPCWNNPKKLPYTFALQTDYTREGKILGDHVNKTFPGKKVAYFYQDDDLGRSGVAGLDKVIPRSSVVARESYQPGFNDVSEQMQAIARARADVIVSFSVPSHTVLLRLAQQKSGNTAKLVVNYSGSDPTTLSDLLESAAPHNGTSSGANPLIQGIITDNYLPPLTDTSNKWIQLVRMIHSRYLPAQPLSRYTELGVLTAYLFVQVLQQTGRDLTRQSLVDTLKKGDFPGPGVTPLRYNRTSHAGYTGTQIGVIKGNAIVLQGKPMTTDGADGPVQPHTATSPQPPANGIPRP